MPRFIILALLQCAFTASGQMMLKIAMNRMPSFSWSRVYFHSLFHNWPFVLSGALVLSGVILWMHILKHYDFSIAYPVSSFSYVIGMLAGSMLLHENIPATRWIGLALILLGLFVITRK